MPGQWMQKIGRAGAMAVVLFGTGLSLSGCISDQQAVDLGLATSCDGTTTYSPVGDQAGRYYKGIRTEVCKGPKKDAGNRDQVVIVDCSGNQQMIVTARQSMADQRRHGLDFDKTTPVAAQLIRLKLGLADFAAVGQGLTTAGVPFTQSAGGAEQCKATAGTAVPLE